MTMAARVATVDPAVTAPAVLTRTYLRLAASCDALNVRVSPAGGPAAGAARPGAPFDGAELTERPELLDAFIGAEAARIREKHGHAPRPDVAVARALHDYLWSVSLLMSGAWYPERRVPRVRRCGPAIGPRSCPAPGWWPTRRRCAPSCVPPSPTTYGPCWARSDPACGEGRGPRREGASDAHAARLLHVLHPGFRAGLSDLPQDL